LTHISSKFCVVCAVMCDTLVAVTVEIEPEKFHVQYLLFFMSEHQATEVLVPINWFFNTILTVIVLHLQFDLRNILPRASSCTKCKVPLCK
jgi:hypothetical protein